MFGMVAAAGVNMLSDVKWNRRNMIIFATALSIGLGLQLVPEALQHLPDLLKILLTSGLLPAAAIAIILNLLLPEEEEEGDLSTETSLSGLGAVEPAARDDATTSEPVGSTAASLTSQSSLTSEKEEAVASVTKKSTSSRTKSKSGTAKSRSSTAKAKTTSRKSATKSTKPANSTKQSRPANSAGKTVQRSVGAASRSGTKKTKAAPAKAKSEASAKSSRGGRTRNAATTAATAAKDDKGRPPGIKKPAKPDDLKLISGVGPKLESVLNGIGIYKYDQIAKWKKAEREWVDGYLKFKGRIERDDWVKQAKALAKGGKSA